MAPLQQGSAESGMAAIGICSIAQGPGSPSEAHPYAGSAAISSNAMTSLKKRMEDGVHIQEQVPS